MVNTLCWLDSEGEESMELSIIFLPCLLSLLSQIALILNVCKFQQFSVACIVLLWALLMCFSSFAFSMSGILEFVDTSDMTVMAQSEHFMATDVEWDPTGRYVATGVSWWGHKVDNAFWIWNFQVERAKNILKILRQVHGNLLRTVLLV